MQEDISGSNENRISVIQLYYESCDESLNGTLLLCLKIVLSLNSSSMLLLAHN